MCFVSLCFVYHGGTEDTEVFFALCFFFTAETLRAQRFFLLCFACFAALRLLYSVCFVALWLIFALCYLLCGHGLQIRAIRFLVVIS